MTARHGSAKPAATTRPTASRSQAVWALQTFIVLIAVWLALKGWTAWWLGVVFAAGGAWVGATLAIGDPYPWRPLRLVVFCGYFVRISLLGGTDVALRALNPRLPVRPHLLRYPMTVPPGQPRTLLLVVVSLVPGSLSVETEGDVLIVHALADGIEPALEELERRITWLFSLDGSS